MKKQRNQFIQFLEAFLKVIGMIIMIPLYIIFKLVGYIFKLIDFILP